MGRPEPVFDFADQFAGSKFDEEIFSHPESILDSVFRSGWRAADRDCGFLQALHR